MDTAAETGGLEETVANEEGAQQIYIRFSVKTVATARRELSQRKCVRGSRDCGFWQHTAWLALTTAYDYVSRNCSTWFCVLSRD